MVENYLPPLTVLHRQLLHHLLNMSVNTYPEVQYVCVCACCVLMCLSLWCACVCSCVCVFVCVCVQCMHVCVRACVCICKCVVPAAYTICSCMYLDNPAPLQGNVVLCTIPYNVSVNVYTCTHVPAFVSRCVREHRKHCPKW